MRHPRFAHLFLVVVLSLARAAAAQTEGGIEVRVLSAADARPLPGITLTVTPRTGSARSVRSDENGLARFDSLEPGLYAVTATGVDTVTVREPSVRVVARRISPLRMELFPREGQLEESLVVARARGADPYGAATSAFRNREELRSAVGAGSDVMRALDGLPGLVSTGDFATFSVRGRGPRDNLVFVDGFPLNKVVHFDQTLGEEEDIGGGGRFSIFAPNSISGAEFSPGGWSAAYGGRSGSLLQLEVAGGAPTPSASLRIDIAGVEFAYDGPSGLHEDTSVYFTARRFDFSRVFELIDEEDIGEPELTDVILKTVTDLDERNRVEVLAVLAPERYRRGIDNVLASPDFEDVALLEVEQDLGLLGVSWRRLVGEHGVWTNRLYLRHSDKFSTEGEAYPDLMAPDTPPAAIPRREELLRVDEQETEIGWRSDFSLPTQFGPAEFGLRLLRNDVDYATALREDWVRFVFDTGDPRPPGQNYITLTPEAIDSEYDEQAVQFAAYGEQVFELGAWDLRAGLRFDRDGFADEELWSPRLALHGDLAPSLRLAATAGLYYQSPRFLVRSANPDNFRIRNERIEHYSLGLTRDFGERWSLLVEPYYQRLDRLVVDEGRSTGRVSNAGDGTNLGVDLVLTRDFANGWFLDASYSYNRYRRNDDDGLGDYDADFSRPHFLTVGGSWEINARWKIGARWKYASGRPTDAFRIYDDVLGPGEPLRFSKELLGGNERRLQDYHSLNVRIDYRRSLRVLDVVAFLDVINVYGGPGANSEEFNPRLGVNVSDESDAFPIIGLIFERAW
jgi:hypothetical protein